MTIDPLIKAELAELAAKAEVVRLKVEQGKYWDDELQQDAKRLAGLANGIVNKLINRPK